MAERKRSHDGHRETEEILGEPGAVDHGGRQGGRIAREIGSLDEKKRATERPAGATRVTEEMKSDEEIDREYKGQGHK
jgi:hypothetical protein